MGSLSLLQGSLPNPGIELRSPTVQVDSLPAEPPGKPSEIMRDREAWHAAVHGVTECWARLSDLNNEQQRPCLP